MPIAILVGVLLGENFYARRNPHLTLTNVDSQAVIKPISIRIAEDLIKLSHALTQADGTSEFSANKVFELESQIVNIPVSNADDLDKVCLELVAEKEDVDFVNNLAFYFYVTRLLSKEGTIEIAKKKLGCFSTTIGDATKKGVDWPWHWDGSHYRFQVAYIFWPRGSVHQSVSGSWIRMKRLGIDKLL